MKFTAVVAAFAGFSSLASAQYARVVNDCTFNAFVQSVPYDGSTPSTVTTIPPGRSFQENYRASGSTLKMGITSGLSAPLQFGYSTSTNPNRVYYELNNQYGSPWQNYYVDLAAAQNCPSFDCAPHNTTCYSNNSKKIVYACPRPVSVTATLCAPS